MTPESIWNGFKEACEIPVRSAHRPQETVSGVGTPQERPSTRGHQTLPDLVTRMDVRASGGISAVSDEEEGSRKRAAGDACVLS